MEIFLHIGEDNVGPLSSEEVKAKMRDEYGFNHDAMVDIDSAERANSLKSEIVKTDPRHPDHKSEDTTH